MNARAAVRLLIQGRVQGVGFRPTVYNLARAAGLAGSVCNTGAGVRIEIEGPAEQVEAFCRELPDRAPALARIRAITRQAMAPTDRAGFAILPSPVGAAAAGALVPYDVATCEACLAEVRDPADRRHRYPFTNCTLCGPRFTIIERVPYDRAYTSMKTFGMCPACQAEYDDPADRRYHAQPNACPACGPRLSLVDAAGRALPGDPLEAARALLGDGRILAVRGLGGFHLAVDATNEPAVERLRVRKRRGPKPFAVLSPALAQIESYATVSLAEAALLGSAARPIVLLDRRRPFGLAEAVAPNNPRIGAMLPYSPLHHLLAEGFVGLVMTSGNLAEEPIARDNPEALERLGGLAEAFLLHDRDIRVVCDDSVAYQRPGGPALVRRSRGHAPEPIELSWAPDGILAVGGMLKNTFCLTGGGQAFLSQHVGDLDHPLALDHFERCLGHLRALLGIEPRFVACDLHPDYPSTRFARALEGVGVLAVQHHHAHLAACMADCGLDGEVIGLCLDGTGLGEDGTIWGGEVLVGGYLQARRVARLSPFALPGGDRAVLEPWRSAVGLLLLHLGEAGAGQVKVPGVERARVEALARAAARGVNSPLTSSLGRLFDAVAALLSIRTRVDYDAQAAVELEAAAEDGPALDLRIGLVERAGLLELDHRELVLGLLELRDREAPVGQLSAAFHDALAEGLAEACARIRAGGGPDRVVLSGGCLLNRRLDAGLTRALSERGLKVYAHSQVPANDGGLCLGQAAVAAARLSAQAGRGR